ncbi:H-type lectin domain-containing protein [Paracoccus contaminans]|nr:H-type lectin domain-containing protein [Paracoccus contaminans]
MFSAFEDGGPMWTGAGAREERRAVAFSTPFRDQPLVHLGLSMWDIAGDTNQRVEVGAEGVSAEGFTIVFATWGDTRVARVRVSWLAIGAAGHPDDFDPD